MTQTSSFAYDDQTYELSWDTRISGPLTGTIQCRRSGRAMWAREAPLLDDQNGLMLRVSWSERDGVVCLHTSGEHWKISTIRDRRRHYMSLRGFDRTDDLPPPERFRYS